MKCKQFSKWAQELMLQYQSRGSIIRTKDMEVTNESH